MTTKSFSSQGETPKRQLSPETLAIHSQSADDQFGSIVPPIYLTSTFEQISPGEDRGYCYTRSGNPTRDAFQHALAQLEGGTHAFAFATGIAAENAALQALLKPADKIVVPCDLYGGTHRLLNTIYARWGVSVERADFRDPSDVAAKAQGAAIVWAESPTNPRLDVYDLPAIAPLVREAGALFIVDNTFATPLGQQPLSFGADLVLHSVTKYLAGHSDLVIGALVTKSPEIAEKIGFIQNAAGGGASPFDCWLSLRGIRSFPLRFAQHCANAESICDALAQSELIEKLYFPFYSEHDTYKVARRTLKLPGAIISLELRGGLDAATRFVSELQLFKLAESLGGVKSLSCHPASMTHASVPTDERAKIGLSDGLVRLSVGLESAQDLIADLQQALAAVELEAKVAV